MDKPRLKMLKPLLATTYTSSVRMLPPRTEQRAGGRPWRRARELALIRDCGLCVLCKAQQRVTPATEVDHITPIAEGGAEFHLDNLRSVCSPCHAAVTAEQTRRRHGIG